MRYSFLHLSSIVVAALLVTATARAEQVSQSSAPAAEIAGRIQRTALAQGLYELVHSPQQDALFVASAGSFGEGAAPARILRLDPGTLAIQAEIPLPNKGFGLALDDVAGRLYVGDTTTATIIVIDIGKGEIVGSVQLAEKIKNDKGEETYPHQFRQLVLDPGNRRLYAPGLGLTDSALYVVDTRSLKVEKVVPDFGAGATGITLDAGRGRLFVSNLIGETYTVDTTTLEILKKVSTQGDQLLNLALDAGHGRIFATDQGLEQIDSLRKKVLPDYQRKGDGNQVLVLNADNGSELRRLPTGAGPVALLLDTARERLYVTNRGEGTISVFDTASYALLESISLPSHPNSLALDAKNNVLFATIKNGEKEPKGSDESVVRIGF